MARPSTNTSTKARKARKHKLQRAGLSGASNIGISNGLATVPSRPMKPKHANRGRSANRTRDRSPLVESIEMVTPQMRALAPGLGILAYKDVAEPAPTASANEPEPPSGNGEKTDSGSNAAEFISLDFDDETENAGGKLAEQFELYESEHTQKPKLLPVENFPAPWMDAPMERKGSIGEHLTGEVLEYLRYVSPSLEETKKRNDCIRRLRQVTSFVWPGCSMDVFGSYAMGLFLPDADIDVVITTAGSIRPVKLRSEMYRLSARMKRSQLADRVEVIAKARVPIVKYVDKSTGLSVDIAFDQNSGFAGLESVAGWIKEQPALKPLVLIIKQFLKRRRLNEVVSGGLGGFAVICLTYSLLKSHKDFSNNPKLALENVGLLLIAFFELYGYEFDYRNYAVSVRNSAGRIMKSANRDMETQKPNGLAIEDPNDPSNNISKASFNYQSVKGSFGLASDLLKRLSVTWRDLPQAQRPQFSFLAPLLRYDRKMAIPREKMDLDRALKPVDVQIPKYHAKTRPPAKQAKARAASNRADNESGAASKEPQTKKQRQLSPEERQDPISSPASTETAARLSISLNQGGSAKSRRTHDPFQRNSHSSSSDISDDELPAPGSAAAVGASARGGPNPDKAKKQSDRGASHSSDEDDDADSRTKLTSLQRRQFWKRKGELQGASADADI